MSVSELRQTVRDVVMSARITDMHTHLFPPSFSKLQLSGADNVLTYHYLIAESTRAGDLSYGEFWQMSPEAQAEWIWNRLFVDMRPMSQAVQGVLQIAKAMGANLQEGGLPAFRSALETEASDDYVNRVLDLAGVDSLVMTNDPFDEVERAYWESDTLRNDRFHAALRLDVLVNDFASAVPKLQAMGYQANADFSGETVSEVTRFITDWTNRIHPLYFAFSASDDFTFPEESHRGKLLTDVILPFCRDKKIPLALMIGARRQVNPQLRSAGDSTAKASVQPLERLCQMYPDNKFFATLLSRESQHELAVTARKFRNLMPFGCWWFLNTDSLVDEITRMRLELLGPTFVPQHSDARVLEHVIYKWQGSRAVIAEVLADKYETLEQTGWRVERADIEHDVNQLLNRNFWDFVQR